MSCRCWGVNWIVFITPPRHPHGSDHQGVQPCPYRQLGVTTGSPLPNLSELPVEPVVFLLHMVDPECIPLPVEIRRPQVQHRLCPVGMPTHPGSLQPVLDQVPTCPLDHATTDRIARRKVLVVTHPTAIPIEVADDLPHRLATGALELPLRQRLTQTSDDVAH